MKLSNSWYMRWISILALAMSFFLSDVKPVYAWICGTTPESYHTCDAQLGPGVSDPTCPFPNWKCSLRRDSYAHFADGANERYSSYSEYACLLYSGCPSYCY